MKTTRMTSRSTSDATSGSTGARRAAEAAVSRNGKPDGHAEQLCRLRQVENLLWETAEKLAELAERDQWPPPRDRLCEMAAVLVRIAVTVDVLGHEASSPNGKPS